MEALNISKNISNLRKEKGITQEELASFVGVTKASVSKWENGLSTPDILLLPQIAAYFDVTVDSLIGYESQLSKEQIQKIYQDFCKEFSEKPFEEVFAETERMVKKYYSCYRFLLQICVLWTNHFMLAEGRERQIQVLDKIEALCTHIIDNCKNAGICNDAIMMRGAIYLQLGRAEQVIDELEDVINPYRLISQSDGMLIQAYVMAGNIEKADEFTQLSTYIHLLLLLGNTIQYMAVHMQHKELCMESIRRTDKLIDIYNLQELQSHMVVNYYYQAAQFMCVSGDNSEALRRLKLYGDMVLKVLRNESTLHGDKYFDKLDKCFENLELGPQMVRDKKVVLHSAMESLDNPIFAGLRESREFKEIVKMFDRAGF